MQVPGFIGPSYTLDSINVDCQRCVNWYPEVDEAGTGKNGETLSLRQRPGLELYTTIGSGPIRAFYPATNGRIFIVSGNTLFEMYTDGTPAVVRGTIGSVKRRVSITDNGVELIIADQASGAYLLTFATNAFASIAVGEGFDGYKRVEFQDGYFIVNKPNSREVYISDLYNGASWDALDFGVKEGSPDNLLTIISDHEQLVLLGERTSEIWFNSGNPDFPFQRVPGALLEIGIAAVDSLQKIDNTLMWVSKDERGGGMIVRASGQQFQRVSTHAVETAIASYGDISGATSWTEQRGGHTFYHVNFPHASTSWVYDVATGLWHEENYSDPNGRGSSRHRGEIHIFINNVHLVSDYQNANIYQMKEDVYTDNGAPIRRMRRAPHLANEGNWVYFNTMRVDVETGVGLDGTAQGSDPQLMLRWSDDGGHVWKDERTKSIGKVGEYRQRVEYRRLGRGRDRVFEIAISDPVKCTVISAFLGVEAGYQ